MNEARLPVKFSYNADTHTVCRNLPKRRKWQLYLLCLCVSDISTATQTLIFLLWSGLSAHSYLNDLSQKQSLFSSPIHFTRHFMPSYFKVLPFSLFMTLCLQSGSVCERLSGNRLIKYVSMIYLFSLLRKYYRPLLFDYNFLE